MSAQVRDAAQVRGARGVGADRGQGGGELADLGHGCLDARVVSGARTRQGQALLVQRDGRAHVAQQRPPGISRLRRRPRPRRDAHAPARHHRGRQEGPGVGQVRFDGDVAAAGTRREDVPGREVRAPLVHDLQVDASARQGRERHLHVRHRRDGARSRHEEGIAHEGRDEQQRGEELRGGRGVHPRLRAQRRADRASDREGQVPALTVIGDGRAHAHQRVQERAEGARVGLLVPIKERLLGRQGSQGRQETHDGAGQAAVDATAARRQRHRRNAQDARPLVIDACAHHLQGGREQARVACVQGAANNGRGIGDGRQVQGARRDRLRARHLDRGIHGGGGQRRRPGGAHEAAPVKRSATAASAAAIARR